MTAEQIEDIKGLTSKLFLGESFDAFLVREAQIVTYNSFTIDGHIRKNFYNFLIIHGRYYGNDTIICNIILLVKFI